MKKARILTVLALVAVMAFVMTACGGTTYKHSETEGDAKTETSITLSGSKFTMVIELSGMGEAFDYKATAKGTYTQDGEKITLTVNEMKVNKGSDEMKELIESGFTKGEKQEGTLKDDVLTLDGIEYKK